MKKRTKKYISIGGIFILLIVLFCFCYYRANANVPREYKVDKYEKGESVKLDNLEITLNNFEKLDGAMAQITNYRRYDYVLDFTIKNISNEDQPLWEFYDGSSLINDKKLFSESLPEEAKYKNADFEYVLKKGENKDIKVTYNSGEDLNDLENLEFYISHKLYENEIKEEFDNLKMYDKCILINGN